MNRGDAESAEERKRGGKDEVKNKSVTRGKKREVLKCFLPIIWRCDEEVLEVQKVYKRGIK